MSSQNKLSSLRQTFDHYGISGLLIPHADEFQNEFVPPHLERLRWLTGFTGSAGHAIVLKDKAAVFSDGRYTIQLPQEVDQDLFSIGDSTKKPIGEWLGEHAPAGAKIGYDPKLHSAKQIHAIRERLNGLCVLVPLNKNPIDDVWADRPQIASTKVAVFDEKIAGRSSADKRLSIAETLQREGCASVVLTLPDSIAWLLNIRGSDVSHNPVALSQGILYADASFDWFIDENKLTPEVTRHIGNGVRIFAPEQLENALQKLKSKVMIDPQRSSEWFAETLQKNKIAFKEAKDPCILLKAIKTGQEQEAMRECHIRDGAAMVKFLYWLSQNAQGQTEITIDQKLEEFRRADPLYKDSSFDTIAGWAGNGAIVHYRAKKETAATISGHGILLLDSGAQYSDGTTDITRTIAIGEPAPEMKDRFTRVLKGHIGLASAKFPKGTTGAQLDTLARKALWDINLDYAHGTGHGVGCYLSVHEESASISPRGADAVLPGMIISNEPGYYKQSEYGIRIENLILCYANGAEMDDGREMLEFETLTVVPIDRKLIEVSLLESAERQWLNDYHARVDKLLSPLLTDGDKGWLKAATAAI